jgi:hypothetical protein
LFKIIGPLVEQGVIASGQSIRELTRLRKLKAIARIELEDGSIHTAEVHWYEAHGVGRKEFKIKRFITRRAT